MPVIDQEWRALSAAKRDVLVAIALEGAATGVDIHRRVRGDDGNDPRTYETLRKLREDGYIDKRETADGREKQNYLTADGKDLLRRSPGAWFNGLPVNGPNA